MVGDPPVFFETGASRLADPVRKPGALQKDYEMERHWDRGCPVQYTLHRFVKELPGRRTTGVRGDTAVLSANILGRRAALVWRTVER